MFDILTITVVCCSLETLSLTGQADIANILFPPLKLITVKLSTNPGHSHTQLGANMLHVKTDRLII